MKAFNKYLIVCAVMIGLFLSSLDCLYTYIYSYSNRSKIQFLRSYKNDKLDYIFIGSSRVENGLNPKIIDSITGATSINMGIQGARLKDIFLLLQLIDSYEIQTKAIFVQLDYIYNMQEAKSTFLNYQLTPFVEDKVIADYFKDSTEDQIYNKLPFVRYSRFDQKLGIRELFANLLGKKSGVETSKGFEPLFGSHFKSTYSLPENISENDSVFKAMKAYIKMSKLNVSFFCSPIRSDTENLYYIDKLKIKCPDLLDYSDVISNHSFFKDNLHLNQKGATEFSILFAKDLNY